MAGGPSPDYFAPGDRTRLDRVRRQQAGLSHPDECFLLDAPKPALADWKLHRTGHLTANAVYSEDVSHAGRTERIFYKPLRGVRTSTARDYGHDSPVDLGLHEVIVWRLARELGRPWADMVPPAVWYDPSGDILDSGPLILGRGDVSQMPPPGTGFGQQVSDAAFFDSLIGHQDRHDENLRTSATPPPRLWLLDHGYAFARHGDPHNWLLNGFFIRLRRGDRVYPVNPWLSLDYTAMSPLSMALQTPHETDAIAKLIADITDLLGVAELLPDDRARAMRTRIDRMHRGGEILPEGDF